MTDGRIFTLKLTADSIEVIKKNPNSKQVEHKEPEESDINLPRWEHWYQRKLARVGYATLLGMSIEPSVHSRNALKALHPERYEIFLDRADVAKTLLGYDLPFYEDHMREGDMAGDKYVSLTDYYEFMGYPFSSTKLAVREAARDGGCVAISINDNPGHA